MDTRLEAIEARVEAAGLKFHISVGSFTLRNKGQNIQSDWVLSGRIFNRNAIQAAERLLASYEAQGAHERMMKRIAETMPDDVDNTKEWQNPDNWEYNIHTGRAIYHGLPPAPQCIADRMVECADGSRYDPATGLTWPSRSGYTIPDDVDTSGEQWVHKEPELNMYAMHPAPWHIRLWWHVRNWWGNVVSRLRAGRGE